MGNSPFFFICGMSRGGTTWLGKSLNGHSQVAVIGETRYWGRLFIDPDCDGVYSKKSSEQVRLFLRSGTKAFFGKEAGNLTSLTEASWMKLCDNLKIAGSSPNAIFEDILKQVGRIEGKGIVVEKTPHHLNYYSRIRKYMPTSKFIVMIREPYSFMLSYKNQGLQKSKAAREHMASYYHPLGCALVWRGYARQSLKIIRELGDDVLVIRFEDLQSSTDKVWEKVTDFLKVGSEERLEISDQNSSFVDGVRPKLANIDRFWMNFISGSAINELGYSIDSKSFRLIHLLRSLIEILPWASRVVIDLYKKTGINIFKHALVWIRIGVKQK